MLIGILVLIAGYILLSGGGTDDPTEFSEAIFDTRRMYVVYCIGAWISHRIICHHVSP